MNAEAWAALGSRRGTGESVASWLRASPVGMQAMDIPDPPPSGGQLYCPACRVDEEGRRRWYTREDWPSDGVVCITHALPLLRFDAPPARLRGRLWRSELREEFRALGVWTQQGSGGEVGRAIVRAVSARSDPRVAYSRAWAEAQWHLWATGWPVPAAPRLPSCGRLAPRFQFDRLALAAIAHRVYIALECGRGTGWPALPIRNRVLRWLEGRIGHVAACFRDADSARPFA